jgi:hypothetical protein
MWPVQLKALKEAFEAHDSNDWERCRDALRVFFEYESPDEIGFFDSCEWNHRHVFRWQNMLVNTKLGYESDDEPSRIFYQMIKEQIYIRIPPALRSVFKDHLKNLSPDIIRWLENSNILTVDNRNCVTLPEAGKFLVCQRRN